MRHHAVKGREVVRDEIPFVCSCANADKRPLTIYQHCAGTKPGPTPDTFTLDLGIEAEGWGSRGRETQVNEVTIVIAREP